MIKRNLIIKRLDFIEFCCQPKKTRWQGSQETC